MKCKLLAVLTLMQHKCSRKESNQAFTFPVGGNFHNEPPLVMYRMEVTKKREN